MRFVRGPRWFSESGGTGSVGKQKKKAKGKVEKEAKSGLFTMVTPITWNMGIVMAKKDRVGGRTMFGHSSVDLVERREKLLSSELGREG